MGGVWLVGSGVGGWPLTVLVVFDAQVVAQHVGQDCGALLRLQVDRTLKQTWQHFHLISQKDYLALNSPTHSCT